MALLEHRVTRLENLPPRMEIVETQIEVMTTKFEQQYSTMEKGFAEVHGMKKELRELHDVVMRLFWTGAGVIAAGSIFWAVFVLVLKLVNSGIKL